MADTKDLMQRYNITLQSVRRFISRNLDKINDDGVEHAKQTPEGWQFDDIAVQKIDKLRGLSQVAIVDRDESERIKELKEENENLRHLLLVTQSKVIQLQDSLNENQKLLADSEKKLLTAKFENKSDEVETIRLQSELQTEKTLHNFSKERADDFKKQLEDTKNQLDKLKSRGLIDRLFNNF